MVRIWAGPKFRAVTIDYLHLVQKNQTPTIKTLDKVCIGLGISLSQFFAEGTDAIVLTKEQKEILDNWSALNATQRKIVLELIKNM